MIDLQSDVRCPPLDRLAAHILREPPESDIETHLRSCARCRRWSRRLREADDVVTLYRHVGAMTATPHDSETRRFQSYEILEFIDEGSTADVYLARQASTSRTVALKLIKAHSSSPSTLQRFARETKIMGQLEHPGIARIYDAGVSPQPYIAMEVIHGSYITVHADERGLDRPKRLALIAQVCDAIQHAHDRGIVHRDLKPSNILVDVNGQPKILDFGISRAMDADARSASFRTRTGSIMGTVPYMAPEQLTGHPDLVDQRTDVHALGVITYELLTGELPYNVHGKPVAQQIRIIDEHEPRPLSMLKPSMRGDLDVIVSTALEKDKEHRYSSAGDFSSDIRNYLARRPIAARPPSKAHLLRKLVSRHRVAAIFLAILFIVISATAVIMAGMYSREKSLRQDLAESNAKMYWALGRLDAFGSETSDAQVRLIIDEILAQAGTQYANLPLARAVLNTVCARRLIRMEEYAEAEALIAQALELVKEGRGDPYVEATIHDEMGRIRSRRGQYQDALMSQERSRQLFESINDRDPLDLLRVRSMIIGTLTDLGRYDDAELATNELLAALAETPGSHRSLEQGLRHRLARIRLLHSGDLAQAKEANWQVFRGRTDELGSDDRRTIDAAARLGGILCVRGEFDDAERLLLEALSAYPRFYPPEHAVILSTRNMLAVCLRDQGRLDEAESIFEELLAVRLRAVGEHHPHVANLKANLARTLLLAQRRLDDAKLLFEEVLELRREIYTAGHADIAEPLVGLARIALMSGDPESAVTSAEEALSILKTHLNPEHYLLSEATIVLASCKAGLGEVEAAETMMTDAIARLEEVLGPQHPKCLAARRSLEAIRRQRVEISP